MSRVIFSIIVILQRYFQFLLDYLDMSTYFFVVLHVVLVFQDFKYAEFMYHFCLESAFTQNRETISGARQGIMTFWKNNGSAIWSGIKSVLFSGLSKISKLMPAKVQVFTEPLIAMFKIEYENSVAAGTATDTDFTDAEPTKPKADAAKPEKEAK